jgi:hypothetical protein
MWLVPRNIDGYRAITVYSVARRAVKQSQADYDLPVCRFTRSRSEPERVNSQSANALKSSRVASRNPTSSPKTRPFLPQVMCPAESTRPRMSKSVLPRAMQT